MACTKDHTGEVPRSIEKLQDSQAGFRRHKYVGCACLLGQKDAAKSEENLREHVRALRERVGVLEAHPPRRRASEVTATTIDGGR